MDKYVGEFRDNKRTGQGAFTWASGKVNSGEWKDGKPVTYKPTPVKIIDQVKKLLCRKVDWYCPETTDTNTLVIIDGIHFKKFTDVPFTGQVTGKNQGLLKEGKKQGSWVGYHENGYLL
jgi:hypothetical protein